MTSASTSTTQATVFIDEDFADASGSTPPSGWTNEVLEGNSETDQWRFDNPGRRSIELAAPFAVYDSDALSDDNQDENIAFETPVFNASQAKGVFLQFDQDYRGIAGGENASRVYIEAYNGSEWKEVYTTVDDATGTTLLDLTDALAGIEQAQVRFRFDGNWSFLWAIDNVKIVDYLDPGVTAPTGNVGTSESSVPDPLDFKFSLQSRPSSDVTLSFQVDGSQLNSIQSLTFTPENWNIAQTSVVSAVPDGIEEGENQTSNVKVVVTSDDPNYNGLTLEDVPVQITDGTIPGFTSYRTVDETYKDLSNLVAANPTLASWVDIGDSYDKATPGGNGGYDIYSLEITNKETTGEVDKPVLFVQGSIHAREYATAEVVTRFAEQLVNEYGEDPDITWLLDHVDIRVVPIANPDGRKFAEQGYSWRKNTNPNVPEGSEPASFPNYGVDLNRNYASKWGEVEGGASTDPADLTYQGPAPFSEPESQALRDYLLRTFPDQKGESDSDPAPDDATGVYLDVHSFGNLVLYPFGWTNEPAPNREGLRNLGLKFGYFTERTDGEAYDVQQSIGLYPTSGTTDDWVYDTFGTAAYTLELGNEFFEQSDYFEETIDPEIIPTLLYAAKAARRPYQTPEGPDSTEVTVTTDDKGAIKLEATADATRYADGNLSSEGITEGLDLPNLKDIAGARYTFDNPSWIEGTPTYELTASDGTFDSTVERLTATVDTSGLSVGRHTLFVESVDSEGNYGVPTAVFLEVSESASDSLTGVQAGKVLAGGTADDLTNRTTQTIELAEAGSASQISKTQLGGSNDLSVDRSSLLQASTLVGSEADVLTKLGNANGLAELAVTHL
ncbi:hypothetical protein IFO70_20575 [Phormidium tenue FACHB-886]|nr:hypothetical protein [Phormidium tenue FACHB-886]